MSVPVVLLTGFLGSGKTTFINWLIKTHPELKISLILNEFGDVPIESQFVEKQGIQMAELKNGCLCCVAKADIPRIVKYILDQSPQTEFLIVEASGLSDPAPVYASLSSPELAQWIHLDLNLCVVDAVNFEATRQKFPIVMSQVGDADVILISKIQEAGPEKVAALKQMLKNNIGTIRILEINDSLSPSFFLDPNQESISPLASRLSHSEYDHTHEPFTELYFKTDKLFDSLKFNALIKSLPTSIIRAKGIVNLNQQKFLFQLVGNRSQLIQAEWNPAEPHLSALIFIGTDFDKSLLESQLQNCLL